MLLVSLRVRFRALLLVPLLLLGFACSDDDGGGDEPASPKPQVEQSSTTTAEAEVLQILVSNDDGVKAEGLDAVVEALRAEPDTEVTVVAPAENQSGQGENTTTGELAVTETTTAGGYEATAVRGRPADSMIHALEAVGLEPDLVVSGTNEGQNYGPLSAVSGTVGAAKAAVRRGVPALAVSTGFAGDGATPDHEVAAELAVGWVRDHRAALLADEVPVQVVSINVPTCGAGELRGLLEVPVAAAIPEGTPVGEPVDCTSSRPEAELADDVAAFHAGFATQSVVSHEAPPPAPIPPAGE